MGEHGAAVDLATEPVEPGEVLAVVVVNYASWALLSDALTALEAAPAGQLTQIVVVDSFSSDEETGRVRALATERGWTFVGLPTNPGFGAAVNAGIAAGAALGAVAYLLLNPDAQVTAETVSQLFDHCRREPMALLSPRIVDPASGWSFDGSELVLDSGRVRSSRDGAESMRARAWLPGTALMMHRQLLECTGGLAEGYFMYWEDVEFSYRCVELGARLVLREDLVAVHTEGGTQGSRRGRAKSPLYYRYNCRNRLLFAAQHLDRRHLLRWIALTPRVSWEILLRGGRRQLLVSLRPLSATIGGSVAGLTIALAALVRGPRPAAVPAYPSMVAQ